MDAHRASGGQAGVEQRAEKSQHLRRCIRANATCAANTFPIGRVKLIALDHFDGSLLFMKILLDDEWVRTRASQR